jgi:hypothetical protein
MTTRAPYRVVTVAARIVVLALGVVVAGACASSGEPQPDPVPVFFGVEQVPCAFERMGPLREEALPEGDYEAMVRRVLGRAGARRGAHAVLVDDERRLPFRVETRGAGSRVEAGPSRITVAGEMIRYTEAACGATGG